MKDSERQSNIPLVDSLPLRGYACLEQQCNEPSESTNRISAEIGEELDSDELINYLEECGVNVELNALIGESTPHLSRLAPQHVREYTLRQWIQKSNPELSVNGGSGNKARPYFQSAVLIALKLTECILEAEMEEDNGHVNLIPLASIAPDNVLIRAQLESKREELDAAQEVIKFVWVMRSTGDDLAIGVVTERLFAMGKILFELFSTRVPVIEADVVSFNPSFNLIPEEITSLRQGTEHDYSDQKKRRLRSAHADETMSNIIAILESNRAPWSLCTLVTNLLECRRGSFCEDYAYSSFADLRVDLQLMVNNPTCFLDNPILSKSSFPMSGVLHKLYGRDEELQKLEKLYIATLLESELWAQ